VGLAVTLFVITAPLLTRTYATLIHLSNGDHKMTLEFTGFVALLANTFLPEYVILLLKDAPRAQLSSDGSVLVYPLILEQAFCGVTSSALWNLFCHYVSCFDLFFKKRKRKK
jgi:hypothetical protein